MNVGSFLLSAHLLIRHYLLSLHSEDKVPFILSGVVKGAQPPFLAGVDVTLWRHSITYTQSVTIDP